LLSFVVSVALPKISFFKKNSEIPISYESITYIATGARAGRIFFGFYLLGLKGLTFLLEFKQKNCFQSALIGGTCVRNPGDLLKENAVLLMFFLCEPEGLVAVFWERQNR